MSAPRGSQEIGWLPDCVYTGQKFESGLAFFADGLGRITRFSRDAADLAAARRLTGQAALPGLVNTYSQSFQRVLRGRTEPRSRAASESAASRLAPNDLYDIARMAFMEMLISGITCAAEFYALPAPADGAQEILRAAHDTGIRLAFTQAALSRTPAECEALRILLASTYPADEAWLGAGLANLATVKPADLKALGAYAHAQRLRLQIAISESPPDNEACLAAHGRSPAALLAELGLLGKRTTLVHGGEFSAADLALVGTAKTTVCSCPITERNLGWATAPADRLLAAGAAVALGTGSNVQIGLLDEGRSLEYALRAAQKQRAVLGPDPAATLFHAATVAGARGLGAPGGALEVGRPADFFTVNLFDPSIAGAGPESLLAGLVFGGERRAVKEVWVRARQLVTGGRHPGHGTIIARFVDLQRRLWAENGN